MQPLVLIVIAVVAKPLGDDLADVNHCHSLKEKILDQSPHPSDVSRYVEEGYINRSACVIIQVMDWCPVQIQ